jgi:hypothetical protein
METPKPAKKKYNPFRKKKKSTGSHKREILNTQKSCIPSL